MSKVNDAILPADFFREKFKKKNDKSAKWVEEEFSLRTYNYFLFFSKEQRDDKDGRATFVSDEVRHPMINK